MIKSINKRTVSVISIMCILFVAVIIVFYILVNKYYPNINVQEGNLEFDSKEVMALNGEWYFFWRKYVAYEDIKLKNVKLSNTVNAPSSFDEYKIDGKALTGKGFGTYIVKVKANHQQDFGLKILSLSTAYEIAVDNKVIAKNGVIGTNKDETKSEFRPRTVFFHTNKDEFYIIVRVANFDHARGGLWSIIYLGTPEKINQFNTQIIKKDFFILGASVALTLYFFIIFIQRRQERGYLLLCITTISVVILYFTARDTLIYDLFSFLNYKWTFILYYLSFFWLPILCLIIIHYFFPDELSPIILRFFIILVTVLSLPVVLLPPSLFTYIGKYYSIVIISSVLISNIATILAIIRKRKYAIYMFMAYFFITMASVYDVLVSLLYIDSRIGYVSIIADLIFSLFVAHIIGKRYSEVYDNLNKMSVELIRKDGIKQEFIDNLSHNIRMPLINIQSLTKSLLNSGEEITESAKQQYLIRINNTSTYINETIKDLTDIVLIRNRDLTLESVSVDLYKLICSTVQIASKRYKKEEDFKIVLEESDKENMNVLGDPLYLQDIFKIFLCDNINFDTNIVTNIHLIKKDDDIRIMIKYKGLYFPDGWEDLLAEEDIPIYDYITQKYGDVLLKLFKIKNIIKMLNGFFSIDKMEEDGTRIHISLPRTNEEACDKNELSIDVLDEEETVFFEEAPTILVADPSTENLQVLTSFLTGEKYNVIGIKREEEAIKCIQNNKINLVIVDYLFSEDGGLGFIKDIRKYYSLEELPVLMLVSSALKEIFSLGIDAGVNDFLIKPLKEYELSARVKTLLEYKNSIQKYVDANMAFLRAQIKPHFIYNTLTAIIALEGDASKKLLINFSRFLRSSFEFADNQKMIPIKKEIQYIQTYVEIEKVRFSHKLQVAYEIDDTLHFMIPPLILQPLIENSIKHGILPQKEGGEVYLRIQQKEQDIIITIGDTGVGMSDEKIKDLLNHSKTENIGISNIHARLIKEYGKGLTIESVLNKGTKFEIMIPYKESCAIM